MLLRIPLNQTMTTSLQKHIRDLFSHVYLKQESLVWGKKMHSYAPGISLPSNGRISAPKEKKSDPQSRIKQQKSFFFFQWCGYICVRYIGYIGRLSIITSAGKKSLELFYCTFY